MAPYTAYSQHLTWDDSPWLGPWLREPLAGLLLPQHGVDPAIDELRFSAHGAPVEATEALLVCPAAGER